MKVLSISTLFPYPDLLHHGVFVKNRLSAMAKKESVTVISPVASSFFHRFITKYKPQIISPQVETCDELTVYRPRFLSVPGFVKEIEMVTCFNAIQSTIKRHKLEFDVIDTHWGYPDLVSAVMLKKETGKPVVFTLRGMETFYKGDFRQKAIEKALNDVDAIISLSQEMVDYVKNLGYKGRVTLIPNGVNTSVFNHGSKESARNILNLNCEEKIIIGVGSLIRRKGFDIVIQALSQLPSNLSVKFFIIGKAGHEGDYENELKRLVERFDLLERVTFVGAVSNSDLRLWYNAADAFCLSSRGEGSPNVLLEALASGCPSIFHSVGDASCAAALSEESIKIDFSELLDNPELIKIWAKSIQSLLGKCIPEQKRLTQASLYSYRDWEWCATQSLQAIERVV